MGMILLSRFEAVGPCFIAFLLLSGSASLSEEKKPAPCTEDAIIVFDASGSMSGNQTLGIPNSRARIDEARAALAQVLPSATKARKVGLVTDGPGPYNQCNVKLDLEPTTNAALRQQPMCSITAISLAQSLYLPMEKRRAGDHHAISVRSFVQRHWSSLFI
jgi:hypothetical protein